MLRPVTLLCGHSACRNCYRRLLEIEEQKSKTTALCPECRKHFGRESLIVSYAMDRVTSSLEVQCLNEDCEWKGQLGEAEDHNRQCPRQAKISCPLGCNEKLLWQFNYLEKFLCVIECFLKYMHHRTLGRNFNAGWRLSIAKTEIVFDYSQPLFSRTRKKKRAKGARSTQGWRVGLANESNVSPVKSFVLRWRPFSSRFYPCVQRWNENTRKQKAVSSLKILYEVNHGSVVKPLIKK